MMNSKSFFSLESFTTLVLSSLLALRTVSATVVLPDYDRSFHSLPAVFGERIPFDTSASIYLQTINDWPKLCREEGREPDPEDIVTPDDGKSVALLVERGTCTFWEKGEVASSWSPPVEYVIIYDNEFTNELVPMSSESQSDMRLLFVTRRTGVGTCGDGDTLPFFGASMFEFISNNTILRTLSSLHHSSTILDTGEC